MDKIITLIDKVTSIHDPVTLMLMTLVGALGIVGFALYLVMLALKRGARS